MSASPEQVAVAMSGWVDPPRACGPVPGPTGGERCLVHGRVWGERGCGWAVNAADRIVAAGDGEVERLRGELTEADADRRALVETGITFKRRFIEQKARAEAAEAERDALRAQVEAVRALTLCASVGCPCGGKRSTVRISEILRALSSSEPVTAGEDEACPGGWMHMECNPPAGEVTPPAEQRDEEWVDYDGPEPDTGQNESIAPSYDREGPTPAPTAEGGQ